MGQIIDIAYTCKKVRRNLHKLSRRLYPEEGEIRLQNGFRALGWIYQGRDAGKETWFCRVPPYGTSLGSYLKATFVTEAISRTDRRDIVTIYLQDKSNVWRSVTFEEDYDNATQCSWTYKVTSPLEESRIKVYWRAIKVYGPRFLLHRYICPIWARLCLFWKNLTQQGYAPCKFCAYPVKFSEIDSLKICPHCGTRHEEISF